MRFAGVKELKQNTMGLLKEAHKGDIIITAYGKPLAVLHHLGEEDLADHLIENDPAFRDRIEKAFEEYLSRGGLSLDKMIVRLKKRRGTEKN